jgi:hypothetical protein
LFRLSVMFHTFHTFSFHSLFANAILKYFTWFRCDWCKCVRLRAVQTLRARWLGQQRVSDPNGRRPGEQKRRTEAAWLRNFTNLFCIWTYMDCSAPSESVWQSKSI